MSNSESRTEIAARMNRVWAMPNPNTFSIPPISRFIHSRISVGMTVVDPFANKNRIGTITNDLDPEMGCDYTLDACEFLKLLPDECADVVLFDPPYSPRQVAEVYKRMGMTVNMETTQGSFWSVLRDQIARITKPNGVCISFGWSSNGIGKTRGFELTDVLLVAHGGAHYDTICTAEKKSGQASIQFHTQTEG
jgi:hypothetical protein